MYRLFNLPKTKFHSLNSVTTTKNDAISRLRSLEQTCVFCDRFNAVCNAVMRQQSTHTNPEPKAPRKKRIRGTKKYAELLVVTNQSTSEHMAKVQKLNSEDLKYLALTNLNLSELHKLKNMMRDNRFVGEHTFHNLTILEDISEVEPISTPFESVIINNFNVNNVIPNILNAPTVSGVEKVENRQIEESLEPGELIESIESFQQVLPINTFQPEILEELHEEHETEDGKDEVETKETLRKRHHDSAAKHEIVCRTVGAFVEICGILHNPQRGLNVLLGHNTKRVKELYPSIKTIDVYNAAMKNFASRGVLTKLQEVLKYAQREEVAFDVQTYALIFECLGRLNISNNHLKQIRIYVHQMVKNEFTFDRILNEAILEMDQREFILKVMKAYDPLYVPTYNPPSVQYMNHLLNHLNCDQQKEFNLKTEGDETNSLIKIREMRKKIDDQMELEKIGYVTIKSIESDANPSQDVLKCRESLKTVTETWEQAALKGFNRDFAVVCAKRQRMSLEPYLRSIPTKDFITVITDEAKLIAQGSETYSPTVNQLYRELGNKVYDRFKVLRKKKVGILDKMIKIHSTYCDNYALTHGKLDILPGEEDLLNSRQKWQWIEHNLKAEGSSIEFLHQPWAPSVIQGIGRFLYSIVMHDLKIDVNVMRLNNKHLNELPAFYTIFRHQGRIVKEEVKPHPVLSRLYRASEPETLTFPSCHVPMTCPPVPWCSIETGGYLVTPTDFVRLPPQALMQKERLQNSPLNQLYPSFDALNQLAAVPWKVNTRILDCILEVFKKGGSAKLTVPENPENLVPPPPVSIDMDKQQKFSAFRQKLQFRRKKGEMYSLWCDCLYRLSLANHFRDDIFWLPHNMDFRGRVYPVPPHLNHLGSDLARSMLVFAEARPLGPKGLDWLKLHLVNLTGLKKRDPVEDRLQYADDIMDKILDSADNPLTGQMWWTESDEPWQTLACAMEIAAAVRSWNPEEFRSHFPIHQDGSCNGLQHYAALGRDSAGGYSVNLTKASKPQDVYSAVVALVEERRRKDAEAGVEIAVALDGFVKRKVIKQTVMTTVYGVTRYGARLQIARQLKDIDEFPKEFVWGASSYLTTRTFESLRTMFTSTREIQDWFTDCARNIASVCGENVEWVTPLGLPVVQPYFRYKKLPSNHFYEAFHMDKFEKPNVMKQKNAFPPNFIHSLDSSHMMLTSLNCERKGITFVSVHDCYWTHPSTVHIMNKICREQFVALHSEPILDNLSNFLVERYSYNLENLTLDGSAQDLSRRKLNKLLQRLPNKGDFNIQEVLDSVYFFS